MVIDRPSFYFKADKIKRLLAVVALISFILSLITGQFSIQAGAILILVTILSAVAYVILWFLT